MRSIALAVHSLLKSRGLVDKPPARIEQFNTLFSNNARSRADRLRELGWEGMATQQTVREAMEEELDLVLDEEWTLM